MAHILIVEDEVNIRRVLRKVLEEEDASRVISEAADGLEAITAFDKGDYDLILCDIKMPKKDGIEVLTAAQEQLPDTPVVMISGHGDLATAVQAMRLGAYDYIAKPPDLNHLLQTVRSALALKEKPTKATRKKPMPKQYTMVGESSAIKQIYHIIEKVAPTMARVFIQGPNGSGKELVARAIHHQSTRANNPFVEVNCAAIPSELIESELFGHMKGAFTSAHKDRKGTFELANGGTLFLDEIGDMSLAAQAKVLRALEEHKIQRVGSDKSIHVDVRVLAATNKDVKAEIKAGRFREDLYHRLSVIELQVPSLNERAEDIPLLVTHFLGQLSPTKELTPSAMKALQKLNWTGNIRQLRNVIERLHILGGDSISEEDVTNFTQL
jgi:DNA-binding NtrC family response regulator